MKMNFTRRSVDGASCPADKARVWYHDSHTPGLALSVTASSKGYYFYRKYTPAGFIAPIVVQRQVGDAATMTVEQARAQAVEYNNQANKGIDVRVGTIRQAVRADADAKAVKAKTLREVWQQFLAARTLKPSTRRCYENVMEDTFKEWLDLPVRTITREKVLERHLLMGKEQGASGRGIGQNKRAYANLSFRVLRAVLFLAKAKRYLEGDNPVSVLREAKQWYPVSRRETFLRPHEIHPLMKTLAEIREADDATPADKVGADYVELLLHTGLRREEAAGLRWENIDRVHERTLTVPDTKNGRPHCLPITASIEAIFERRAKAGLSDEYVFAATGVKMGRGHFAEPRYIFTKIEEATGLSVTCHDLRRTFITIAERLDVSHYALKTLVNHKIKTADVTGGYVQIEADRLREPMARIEQYILNAAKAPAVMKMGAGAA